MTTKTSITLSPIKHLSHLKKRRIIINRNIPSMKLPDLVNDIHLKEQQHEAIVNIATMLRKVGDQMDEQLQINNTSSSIDHIFNQRTMLFVQCLSHVLRFFL